MIPTTDFQTAFCTEYETLLHECQSTKETWAEWRANMKVLNLADAGNEELAGELLRLQASYAKSYSRLERHHHDCDRCQFVARMTLHQQQTDLFAGAEETLPA